MNIDRHKPSILLKHVTVNLHVANEQGISVQLSGHTHHRQVLFFRFITSQVYQGYDYGLKWHVTSLSIRPAERALGGLPKRIDRKPEIVFMTFM
jgi:uncharacterized protein